MFRAAWKTCQEHLHLTLIITGFQELRKIICPTTVFIFTTSQLKYISFYVILCKILGKGEVEVFWKFLGSKLFLPDQMQPLDHVYQVPLQFVKQEFDGSSLFHKFSERDKIICQPINYQGLLESTQTLINPCRGYEENNKRQLCFQRRY